MVFALCKKYDTESAIEQSKHVLSNLQCILNRLYGEQAQSDRVVQARKRRLRSKPANSFEYFLSKSIMYLNMANSFYEWNKKSREMFGALMRNMDIYTKLRNQLKEKIYNVDQLADGQEIYDINFIIVTEEDMIIENGIVENMDVSEVMEFEEFELEEFYNWVNKISERKELLIAIETIFDEIQDIFSKRCFSLYQVLDNYYQNLKQYLYNNKDNLKSCKFYREISLSQYVCCKYHFLKRLLKRVDEEKEHIAKYNAAYEGRWKDNDNFFI
ncbi:uncharacterized protein LOC105259508 [Camponotus floridanus]|uniref:uncharacterized protein LOC105259508 n=1 Tax=Camponotus floridanus TaxID=104421 RepID=UPI000DC67D7C|nr:uncharacterized protein LOC105259508 [Camponotus floridanus]